MSGVKAAGESCWWEHCELRWAQVKQRSRNLWAQGHLLEVRILKIPLMACTNAQLQAPPKVLGLEYFYSWLYLFLTVKLLLLSKLHPLNQGIKLPLTDPADWWDLYLNVFFFSFFSPPFFYPKVTDWACGLALRFWSLLQLGEYCFLSLKCFPAHWINLSFGKRRTLSQIPLFWAVLMVVTM